jgi:glycosyltransferase involved in cell wall biosynthesis
MVPGVTVVPVQERNGLGDLIAAGGRLRRKLVRGIGHTDDRANAWPSPPVSETANPEAQENRTGLYSRVMSNISAVARWSAHADWAKRAAAVGMGLARGNRPDVIAVSSPPHPTQLAGVRLTRALGIPFVADFRDPWLFGELDDIQSAFVDRALGAVAQARTFRRASKLILNTTWAAQAVRHHDARLDPRVATVTNGYDRDVSVGRPDISTFRVAFVGFLYDFMNPEPLLAACGRLRERARPESMRVEFVGANPALASSLAALARVHGLEHDFELRPRAARPEALQAQARAAVQVVFDYPGPLRIPMKFYDGVQMYGDLLLIGQSRSALADAAARVGLSVCPPNDAAAIDSTLQRAFMRWRAQDYPAPLDSAGVFAREHTSRRMLGQLEDLLNQMPQSVASSEPSRTPELPARQSET